MVEPRDDREQEQLSPHEEENIRQQMQRLSVEERLYFFAIVRKQILQ